MSTMDLLSKIRELKELEALISEAQAEAEFIKDVIKAVMVERNTEEMDVDVFKIRYKTVKCSRFNTTAFKAAHKELYEQYTKQGGLYPVPTYHSASNRILPRLRATESRRFTVSA